MSTRNILRNLVEDFSWLSEKYLRKYRLYDMKYAILLIPYFVWELYAENNSSQLLKNLRYLCCSLPWMWSVGREGTLQPQVVPAAPTSSATEWQHIKTDANNTRAQTERQKSRSLLKDKKNAVTEKQPMVCTEMFTIRIDYWLHAVSCQSSVHVTLCSQYNERMHKRHSYKYTYYVEHNAILKKHWEVCLFASAAVVTTASICMCRSCASLELAIFD